MLPAAAKSLAAMNPPAPVGTANHSLGPFPMPDNPQPPNQTAQPAATDLPVPAQAVPLLGQGANLFGGVPQSLLAGAAPGAVPLAAAPGSATYPFLPQQGLVLPLSAAATPSLPLMPATQHQQLQQQQQMQQAWYWQACLNSALQTAQPQFAPLQASPQPQVPLQQQPAFLVYPPPAGFMPFSWTGGPGLQSMAGAVAPAALGPQPLLLYHPQAALANEAFLHELSAKKRSREGVDEGSSGADARRRRSKQSTKASAPCLCSGYRARVAAYSKSCMLLTVPRDIPALLVT